MYIVFKIFDLEPLYIPSKNLNDGKRSKRREPSRKREFEESEEAEVEEVLSVGVVAWFLRGSSLLLSHAFWAEEGCFLVRCRYPIPGFPRYG